MFLITKFDNYMNSLSRNIEMLLKRRGKGVLKLASINKEA